MGIKLWMDDERMAPPGWVHAKNAEQAQAFLIQGDVDELSLDHDLGEVECSRCNGVCDRPCKCHCHSLAKNGTHVVNWMAENGIWPKTKPRVHSANPVGAAYMRLMIERYGPYASHEEVAPEKLDK